MKKWRNWKIKTPNKTYKGKTNGPLKVVLTDFSDVLQIKDKKGQQVITSGSAPPIYFEK